MTVAKKAIKINIQDSESRAKKPVKKKPAKKAALKKRASPRPAPVKKKPAKKAVIEPKLQKIAVIDEDKDKEDIVEFGKEVKPTEEQTTRIESMAMDVEAALNSKQSIVKDNIKAEESSITPAVDDDVLVEEALPIRRKISTYKKIAFSFIALTLVLVLVILYFTVIKVSIVLVPNQERVSNSMVFDVHDGDEQAANGNKVNGIVRKVAISHSGTYAASGEEIIGKEAIGKATIINNYNKNQPLVATTRLLTSDGKLFRLKNTVNVPAGDSVTVEIYADEPDPEMAIGPTKFTIPGLWAGMQDDIYAESSADIVYQQKVKKYIKEEDIEGAIRDMKQQLLVNAKKDINENFSSYSQIKYKIDENSVQSEIAADVDEEVDEFSAEMTADVVVVAFDGQAAADAAKQKFLSAMSRNKELISFDSNSIIYALNTFDDVAGVASLNATFEGKVSLKDSSEVVDLEKIRGINRDQLNAYLSEIDDIAGYEIEFSPGFLPGFMQIVPHLVDRIIVDIKR